MATTSQTVLITGANTGLGLEAVKALLQSQTPYTILLGSRSPQKGQDAISSLQSEFPSTPSTLTTISVDLESDSSIEAALTYIQAHHNGQLDVLINNGGGNFDGAAQSGSLTYREAWNKSWDVNVAGTMYITHTLIPCLLKSANPRLLFVTSGTSALSETERGDGPFAMINKRAEAGWPKEKVPNPVMSYRSSKTGLNMAMREWYRTVKNDGVKVWAISPGFLATGLAGIGPEKLKQMGALDPSVGGHFIKDVVEGKRDEDVGKVIRSDMIQPW